MKVQPPSPSAPSSSRPAAPQLPRARPTPAASCSATSSPSRSKDANAQKAAEASLYFYLGRISSAATAAQMKALFETQGKTITNANAGALMSDCAKAVQTKVDMLQSLAPPQPAAAKPAKPTPPQGR